MSIPELVSVLRSAYEMHEFDRVKYELVTRDTDLKALVGSLKEESQLYRIAKIAVEIKLKEKEEGKRPKRVKKDVDSAAFAEVKIKNTRIAKAMKHYLDTIEYFRAENNKLACENMDLEESSDSLELTTAMNEVWGPTAFERNGDTRYSPPSRGKKDVRRDSGTEVTDLAHRGSCGDVDRGSVEWLRNRRHGRKGGGERHCIEDKTIHNLIFPILIHSHPSILFHLWSLSLFTHSLTATTIPSSLSPRVC
ncbi:hypothetical protein RJT34_04020 [Clitoria ternatea]|uniref:Uncharacterized protein n=1 Tax=Clitoria ternatea TaxID=43366 RepID=A0AAN9KMQ1_CLITE